MNQLECSKEHSDDISLKTKADFAKQIKIWVLD